MTANNIHILIIDDNEDILFMLKAMLKHKGYRVSIKETPENIESYIKEITPDIILMDMLLSGADGREICMRIKSDPALTHIPVIMISAHPHAKKECIEAGANSFLDKPFEMNGLFNTIESLLPG
jgi:DNA-binding response OmpR family regulator